jgi:disulfide bond formation protein DsbB
MGSLYFSEVRQLVPCTLCWYQRIALYPIAVILMVGIVRRDPDLPRYVLPLSIGGLLIASYHVLLEAGIVKAALVACTTGVSCATPVPVFGPVTLPMLSLAAFFLITAGMVVSLRRSTHGQ